MIAEQSPALIRLRPRTPESPPDEQESRKFLGPMTYPDPKGERNNSMSESDGHTQVSGVRRRGTRVIWRKLDLPESQSPEDETRRPSERHMLPAPRSATASFAGCRNLRNVERCPVRAIKEMSDAPRGALLYSRFSREELGGMFLDLMPNLASRDKGDSSLAENQRPCPGVWSAALGDPRDMVKAVLLDSPVSRRRNSSSAGKTPVTGARPVVASCSGRRNLQGMERCPMRALKETNRAESIGRRNAGLVR